MTGDDLVAGFWIFVGAVCAPALIATLCRKYIAKPNPTVSLAESLITSILIYIGGFFATWAILIFTGWRGSEKIEHLLISPLPDALTVAIYGAIIGATTGIFSTNLPRELKSPLHHKNIFIFSLAALAILKLASIISLNDYIDRKGQQEAAAPQTSALSAQQSQYGLTAYDAPLGRSQDQLNLQFNKLLDQAELSYSPLNPSSPNYNQKVVDEIEAKVRLYESQGTPAPLALRRALKERTGVDLKIPPVR